MHASGIDFLRGEAIPPDESHWPQKGGLGVGAPANAPTPDNRAAVSAGERKIRGSDAGAAPAPWDSCGVYASTFQQPQQN